MGVHDLWRLLAPCGHRLSLTTLTRRRLAIDVSIWIQQFVKALPSSQPHLLGLLRRLCKLHFYHIYPVCVFDGPAPMLKKRTLDQRRHLREKQRESFERVAERLVLEQLKMKSVAQLRKELAKRKKDAQQAKEEKITADDDVQLIDPSTPSPSTFSKRKRRPPPTPDADAGLMRVIDEADDDPELLLLRQLQDEEDARGSLDLIAQWQTQDDEALQSSPTSASPPSRARRPPPQAMLTAEERKAGRSAEQVSDEEEEVELIPVPEALDPLSYQLPASGDLDSTVLASLPISLQYSLLEQHRSHHHTLSMRRYAAVKGDMSAFSAMQMGAFLKQVEFNKTIDRKRAEMNSGEEVDGYKVRRLAGDGTREFIYHKRDERAEAAAQRVKEEEEEEEEKRRADSRQQREAESGARYIHSHLNRIKQREQSEWRCDDCGHHNKQLDPSAPTMCDVCGSARPQRPSDGGTVNILVGRSHSQASPAVKRELVKEDVKPPTRVASFYGKAAGEAGDRREAAALYWTCPQCQYLNAFSHSRCEICGKQKDPAAEPVVVDLTDDKPSTRPAARRPSHAEVIHLSEDEEGEQLARPNEKAQSKAEGPIEISFDMIGKETGDEDVFPEDFFSAFEDAGSAPLPPLPTAVGASPTKASKATFASPPSPSLLLPAASLREAEKIRRPRMRLKKLDVKEIIW